MNLAGIDTLGIKNPFKPRKADRAQASLALRATAQTIDNGKSIRHSMAADSALAIHHFRDVGCVARPPSANHEPAGVRRARARGFF